MRDKKTNSQKSSAKKKYAAPAGFNFLAGLPKD